MNPVHRLVPCAKHAARWSSAAARLGQRTETEVRLKRGLKLSRRRRCIDDAIDKVEKMVRGRN